MFTRRPFLVVAGLLSAAAAAVAQTNTGQIAGIVRDAQGGVLPGVTVIAVHVESGTRIARVTDEADAISCRRCASAPTPITVELAGFKRLLRSGVVAAARADALARLRARSRRPHRGGDRQRRGAAAAVDQRRNQRRHREPRGRAAPAQRPQLPVAGAVERRGRDPAGRHARRRAAAGGSAARTSAASAPGTTSICSTASR